jgi:histone-lysine N-methyltransferase SETMAR
MLTVFFDSRGMVHHEYAPQGTTITKEYYQEVLHRLRDSVRRKRPDLWAATTCQLHHDNAPAHSSHLIQTFLAKHGIPVVRQAPYSPDMAPFDFWLFPKLKMPLKGARFESGEGFMQNATAQLNTIEKMSSRSVSNKGGNAGISVCITKGTTLKEIRVHLFYMNKCIFANQRFDTF